ncbi:MAG TPA: hypothetical protein VGE28_09995 [Pseudomonas sp.]
MLILDRVLCDCCGQPMCQLYLQPCSPHRVDQRQAPQQTLCPDCLDMAEVIRDPRLAE